jgi:SAM-dependent methyltransferase
MKITGERPVDGITPDALVALHNAGYLEVARRLGPGWVLDIGCGVGFGTSKLWSVDRTVIGADYDWGAAAAAKERLAPSGLVVACTDGARLGLKADSFDYVMSSHIIEHFDRPESHVAEIARVLRGTGTTFILTPNRPADLENPFHLHLFEPPELRELLEQHFHHVWVGGHDATETVKADFAERRRAAQRLLNLDVFDLRHRIPRRWYVALYSAATRVFYRLQAGKHAQGATSIDVSDFFVTDIVDPTTLSLFAVASGPRNKA